MTQVLIDTGLPCFDNVLAKYAFTFHTQWSVCNNRIIRHLQRYSLQVSNFVWIYLIAILGCFNVFSFFFLVVIVFLFVCFRSFLNV
jgi:hypothetical protein